MMMIWRRCNGARSVSSKLEKLWPYSVGLTSRASEFRSKSRGPSSVNKIKLIYESGSYTVERTDPPTQVFGQFRGNAMSSSAALIDSFDPNPGIDGSDVEAAVDNEKLFWDMKCRFLSFKRNNYLRQSEHYQALAKAQYPKFMVVACVDSRVCPSNILGFQPGEAFMVRNVANLVPPLSNGPSETVAALEFAVNTLNVEHIFVVGHSCCAGIEALMTMDDSKNPSFTEKWVAKGKPAKVSSKSAAGHLDFAQLCKHCEKESVSHSLQNLITYPWIADKLNQEQLSIHGGYYDFVSCTFEKWTLSLRGAKGEQVCPYLIKDRQIWS